jgi:MFS family permease
LVFGFKEGGLRDYRRVIRTNKDFRFLWSAQVVSLLGDWFNTIALSVLVADYSGGSGLAISLFLLARFLPPLIFSPFAGVLVDRFDRQKILIWCNVLRTFVVLGFLLATTPDQLWLIYGLTLIQFSLSALFEPGQNAITPSLVPREDLVIANTLASVTWSVMLALGAIIGGVISAIFGITAALVIDALTFALAGFLISRIQVPENAPRVELTEEDDNESGSFWDGIRFLRRNPATAAVLLVKGGGSIGNTDTLMTVFATQLFILGGSGQLSLGIMYSAFGLGAILGPLLLNLINDGSVKRMYNLIFVGFLFAAFSWTLIGGGTTLFIISLGLGIRAMGGSVNWTYSSVIIQKSVPDRYLGRVFSMDFAFFQFTTVISTILHGGIIDILNSEARLPLLDMHTAPTLIDHAAMISQPIIAHNLSMLSFATGIVTLLPVILWLFVLPRVQRVEARRVLASAD